MSVPMSHIGVGNGASELLWLISLAFIGPGDRVLIIGPTFGEYVRLAGMMGANIKSWLAPIDDDFTIQNRPASDKPYNSISPK